MAVPTVESNGATGSGSIGSSATVTISSVAPTASSDRLLIVLWAHESGNTTDGAPVSITYDSVSMTQLVATSDTTGWEAWAEIWYLVDADFSGSTGDIVCTTGAGATSGVGQLGYVLLSGAEQSPSNWDSTASQPGTQNMAATLTSTIAGDFLAIGLAGTGKDTSFSGSSSTLTSVTELTDRRQNFTHTMAIYHASGNGTGSDTLNMDAAAAPEFNGSAIAMVYIGEPSAAGGSTYPPPTRRFLHNLVR